MFNSHFNTIFFIIKKLNNCIFFFFNLIYSFKCFVLSYFIFERRLPLYLEVIVVKFGKTL